MQRWWSSKRFWRRKFRSCFFGNEDVVRNLVVVEKTLNFSVFFWLLLENMCIFLIYKKYVETPKHILFTVLLFELEWGCWKNLPHSHKKVSPNVSVNFGVWFSVGEAAHHFYPLIFGWHFLGMGWWKIPSHFVCVNPSWKIWVYLPSAGKMSLWRVCGGCFGPFMTQSFDGVFDGQYFSLSPELDELKDKFGSCSEELCCSFCLFPEQNLTLHPEKNLSFHTYRGFRK